MANPNLTILGVYCPTISKETWREQWLVTGDDDQTRDHFDKLVLIEAVVEGLDEPFDMSKFGQMQPDHPNEARYMQVGYDEAMASGHSQLPSHAGRPAASYDSHAVQRMYLGVDSK